MKNGVTIFFRLLIMTLISSSHANEAPSFKDSIPDTESLSSSRLLLYKENLGKLTPEQVSRLESFVQEMQDRLPTNALRGARGSVTVVFDLGGEALVPTPRCGSDSSHQEKQLQNQDTLLGQMRGWNRFTIHLHTGFVPVILDPGRFSQSYPCQHGSTYRLAQATLLHEVSHVYDHLNHVSESPEFQVIAHRRNGKLLTRYTGRSPDTYELSSAEEQFAVNFEYFMMDPEFSCRRPTFSQYYRRLWNDARPAGDSSRCSEGSRSLFDLGASGLSFSKIPGESGGLCRCRSDIRPGPLGTQHAETHDLSEGGRSLS